eukprot:scaffold29336_cov56-Isochrysis_galbana.AAC.1
MLGVASRFAASRAAIAACTDISTWRDAAGERPPARRRAWRACSARAPQPEEVSLQRAGKEGGF